MNYSTCVKYSVTSGSAANLPKKSANSDALFLASSILACNLANNSISERDFIKFLKEFRWHLQTIVQQRDIPQIKTKGFFDVDDFYDAVHFNDSGSLKFAQFMHNELVDFICRWEGNIAGLDI